MSNKDMARVVLQLAAETRQLRADFNKAEKIVEGSTGKMARASNRAAKQMETSMSRATAKIGNAAGTMAKRVAGALAAVASARGATQLSDSATRITNALKVAGLEGKNLTDVYDQLFNSAQKNAAPLEALTTLYGRMASAQKELNATQSELLQFTDVVALSLRASGQSAEESAGALLQLSQAMGGGKVQAEEYNSLLDGARPLLQAVAAGMTDAGGSVAKLTQLVKSGKVSSEAFFRAGIAGSDTLREKVAGAEETISQRYVRLQNVLLKAAGKFNEAGAASQTFGKALDELTRNIASIDWSNVIKQADGVTKALKALMDFNAGMGAEFGRKTGLDQFGVWLSDVTGFDIATPEARGSKTYWDKLADAEIKARNDALARVYNDPMEYGPQRKKPMQGPMPLGPQQGPEWPGRQEKVSLKDFPIDPTGSGSKRTRSDDYEREVKQIKERAGALQAVTAAQAKLNPLINDYGYSVEYAQAKQELLTAAQRAGKKITPELAREIEGLAVSYATAVVGAEQLAEKQEEIKKKAEEAMATARDVVSGMVDGFIEGEKAADIFANSLKKIGKALMDDVYNSIFNIKNLTGGGSGGGFLDFLGSIFKPSQFSIASGGGIGLYASGGYTGPGGKNQPAGIVHKGEVVFSQADVARMGGVAAVEALRRGYADGGPVGVRAPTLPKLAGNGGPAAAPITYAPVYNVAQGADPKAIAELRQAMAQDRAEFESKTVATIRKAQTRRIL